MLAELNKLIAETNSMVDKRMNVELSPETKPYTNCLDEDWFDDEEPSEKYWDDEENEDDDYSYYDDDIDDYDDCDNEEGPWI